MPSVLGTRSDDLPLDSQAARLQQPTGLIVGTTLPPRATLHQGFHSVRASHSETLHDEKRRPAPGDGPTASLPREPPGCQRHHRARWSRG